jgi:hypothetical protein
MVNHIVSDHIIIVIFWLNWNVINFSNALVQHLLDSRLLVSLFAITRTISIIYNIVILLLP